MRDGVHRERDAVLHSNLAHELGYMGLHGALFDTQHRADLLVRAAHHQQFEHFLLAIGKRNPARREDPSR